MPTLVPNRDQVNKDQGEEDKDKDKESDGGIEMTDDIPGGGYEKDEAEGSPGDIVDSDLGESIMKKVHHYVCSVFETSTEHFPFFFHTDFPSLKTRPKRRTPQKKTSKTKAKKSAVTMPTANPDLSPPKKRRHISGKAASFTISKPPPKKDTQQPSDTESDGQ